MDELNIIRSMSYEDYFGDMGITKEQKERRIRLAEELEEIYLLLLILMDEAIENEVMDYSDIISSVADKWEEAVERELPDEDYLEEYVPRFVGNAVEVTLRHVEDPWYFSMDRVIYNAENEANVVINRAEYLEAISEGKTMKTWHSLLDGKERLSHNEADGQTIGIFDLFQVGRARLMHPKDIKFGDGVDHPQEIINCRCYMTFD